MIRDRNLSVIGSHITSVAPRESGKERWTRRAESILFLDLLAQGHVDIGPIVTQRENPEDANAVYDGLIANPSNAMGTIFDWKSKERRALPMATSNDRSHAVSGSPTGEMGIGFIGCGEIAAHNAAGRRRVGAATRGARPPAGHDAPRAGLMGWGSVSVPGSVSDAGCRSHPSRTRG
jgi:hypothetical protein